MIDQRCFTVFVWPPTPSPAGLPREVNGEGIADVAPIFKDEPSITSSPIQ
jgi:hypothetical protein